MYIKISNDTVISGGEVIGIFDLDNLSVSKISRDFLNKAQNKGEISALGDDLPKAVVLCAAGNKQTVYLTQVNTHTLKRRIGFAGTNL